MHFETTLNLVWFCLGLLALSSTVRVAMRRSARAQGPPAWLHIVGVALIVTALFPYFSATDDVLRLEDLRQQHDQHHPFRKSGNHELIRLYEALDTPLVASVEDIVLVLFFITLVRCFAPAVIRRASPSTCGRSPPVYRFA